MNVIEQLYMMQAYQSALRLVADEALGVIRAAGITPSNEEWAAIGAEVTHQDAFPKMFADLVMTHHAAVKDGADAKAQAAKFEEDIRHHGRAVGKTFLTKKQAAVAGGVN